MTAVSWSEPPPSAFIVGVTRSGTTLLRMMLDAHPSLAIPPETHFVPHLSQTCAEAPDERARFLEALAAYPRWPDFGITVAALDERIGRTPFTLSKGLRAFYGLYAAGLAKPRWSDKTPAYLHHMELIQSLLEEARFVHLIRDGRDAALSLLSVPFGPSTIEGAAQLWVERVRDARRQRPNLRHYLEIRYEDLVQEPAHTLRRVCAFMCLDYDAAMLDYFARSASRLAEMDRAVKDFDGRTLVTAEERLAAHALVREPPRADRAFRWRREMAPADRRAFEAIAGPWLRELGYDT